MVNFFPFLIFLRTDFDSWSLFFSTEKKQATVQLEADNEAQMKRIT